MKNCNYKKNDMGKYVEDIYNKKTLKKFKRKRIVPLTKIGKCSQKINLTFSLKYDLINIDREDKKCVLKI